MVERSCGVQMPFVDGAESDRARVDRSVRARMSIEPMDDLVSESFPDSSRHVRFGEYNTHHIYLL